MFNPKHINECLQELSQCREFADAPDVISFDIFLHDVEYNPTKKDNEELSAEKAAEFCQKLSLPHDFTESVYQSILSSKLGYAPQTHDQRLRHDIDWGILGYSQERFQEYDKGIAREFSGMENFRERRIEFFEIILSLPHIYYLEHFQNKYEDRAKENIEEAIERLEAT